MSERPDAAAEGVYVLRSPALDRPVQVGVASGRVISVSFPDDAGTEADAEDDHPLLDRLAAYLEGVEDDFDDVEVALTVPTEQRRVLERVRAVPFGQQVSVEALTRSTAGLDPDDDAAVRTVRRALADNPVPILIADHRVRDGPSALPPPVEQRLRTLEGLS